MYQPTAMVNHKVPEWRGKWGYFVHRCYAEGLSKAQVTDSVGSDAGLSSERSYIVKTLPKGVIKGLEDAFMHGQFAGLKRAASITIGLFLTTLGYTIGVCTQRLVKDSPALTRFDTKSRAGKTPDPLLVRNRNDVRGEATNEKSF